MKQPWAYIFAMLPLAGCGITTDHLPACDDGAVMGKATEIINKLFIVMHGAPFVGNGVAEEVGGNEALRACIATFKTTRGGESRAAYTITWMNKHEGTYLIQMDYGDVDAFRKKHGGQPPATPNSAAAAAPAPAQAVAQPQHLAPFVAAPTEAREQAAPAAPAEINRCMEAALDERGLLTCANEEHARQDLRLNAAYKAAMRGLAAKDGLRQAQREWIVKRDKQCESLQDPIELTLCLAASTSIRADELEQIVAVQ